MNRREKLQALIDEAFKGNKSDFARAIKRSPNQVYHWLTGNRNLGDAGARHIEIMLSLGIGYFDSAATVPNFLSRNDDAKMLNPNGYGLPRIDIPALDVVEWLTLGEMFGPEMSKSERSRLPKTFGLRIEDDTNSPKLIEGHIVEINTERSPKNGDFVLARCNPNERPTIKKLMVDGGKTYLTPYNPRYDIITPENLEILGVVQRRIDIEEF